MKKEQFQELLGDTIASVKRLTATKGEEYAADADQLANFKRSAKEAGITPEQVWVVFFNKHLDAIKSYARSGKTLSEPIEGRIDDAILYLLLFKAMVAERPKRPEFDPT